MYLLVNLKEFLSEIYNDRRLMIDLSKKDVKKRFSGTYFGIAWGILQPLMTILIYWAVFQFGFRSGDVGDIPFVLWFISGIIIWLFIAEAFPNASNCFLEYSYLIQKVKFNVNILPLVKIFSSLFTHVIFLILAIFVCILLGYYPTVKIIQIVYYVFATMVFVFALSLITSSIIVFFRDLSQTIGIILLIGMWGTPIAWNLELFDEQVQKIFMLNPVYYLVEGYRDALLGRQWIWEKPILGLYFWGLTFAILLIGSKIFTKLRKHFADTV